jgi:hypothetical protein
MFDTHRSIKLITLLVLGYFLLGLFFGYAGLRLRCIDKRYNCPTVKNYLEDHWLISNTLFWPFTVIDGFDKSNLIF